MCLLPCQEVYYDTSESSAPWPHKTEELAFYTRYVATNADLCGELCSSAYEPILTESLDGQAQHIEHPGTARLHVNLIEENFIQLNVFLKEYKPYLMTDKAAMTWESLLSSIGGCLSLWLGVTIMTFVEVAEFTYTLVKICNDNRKSRRKPSVCVSVFTADSVPKISD